MDSVPVQDLDLPLIAQAPGAVEPDKWRQGFDFLQGQHFNLKAERRPITPRDIAGPVYRHGPVNAELVLCLRDLGDQNAVERL
ncbi:hypothetical protein [Brevundimonas sp.]|uniref:hypothetical protein n=1 Tax=Brevundimonas sp. TaxID=1871086 RepID=UPI0026387545|nr:hypothetical protein [Brevundimonas sp.]